MSKGPQKHMTTAEFQAYAFESQTEDDFQKWILRYAELHGWMRFHPRPALTQSGNWVTAMEGDTGFPDLVLAKKNRPHHLWEVKSMTGDVRPDQRAWLRELTGQDWTANDSGIVWPIGKGFSVGVVRPDMRNEIEKELQ